MNRRNFLASLGRGLAAIGIATRFAPAVAATKVDTSGTMATYNFGTVPVGQYRITGPMRNEQIIEVPSGQLIMRWNWVGEAS